MTLTRDLSKESRITSFVVMRETLSNPFLNAQPLVSDLHINTTTPSFQLSRPARPSRNVTADPVTFRPAICSQNAAHASRQIARPPSEANTIIATRSERVTAALVLGA